ncbi:MFS transporter, partial [Nonomuraea sp. NPDC004297]
MQALSLGRRPQPWSYAALLVLLMLGQATSAIPSPLYSLYAEKWDYPPFLTTVIFAAYGAVAVVAILVSGPLSDRYGRRPVLALDDLLGQVHELRAEQRGALDDEVDLPVG